MVTDSDVITGLGPNRLILVRGPTIPRPQPWGGTAVYTFLQLIVGHD